jgi:hypothetical protein
MFNVNIDRNPLIRITITSINSAEKLIQNIKTVFHNSGYGYVKL